MLHVRIKLVSAIEKMSVQFKYPASNKISFISEKKPVDFFNKIQPFKNGAFLKSLSICCGFGNMAKKSRLGK